MPNQHPTHVGWIPVDETPWRIICKNGAFYRGDDEVTLKFATEQQASKWLSKLRSAAKGTPGRGSSGSAILEVS